MGQRRYCAMSLTAAGAPACYGCTLSVRPVPIARHCGGRYLMMTSGSLPPPGQPLMAHGQLDLDGVMRSCSTRGQAQALPAQRPEPPEMHTPLQTVELQLDPDDLPPPPAAWLSWLCPSGSSPHQLGMSQDSAWPRGLGLPPARTCVHKPL